MSDLETATTIAIQVHARQIDKAGAPYIGHVERVAAGVEGSDEKIVAMLHDVVEDGVGWSLVRLSQHGFAAHIVAAVDAVTKREGEDYFVFVRRASRNPIARAVKRADLLDNLDRTRLPEPLSADAEARLVRYARALTLIDGADDAT